MILKPDEVNEHNFFDVLDELKDINHSGVYDYKFLLEVCNNITEDQEYILIPYIIDRFITEQFEMAEWVGRFQILEDAKEIYVNDMCLPDSYFQKYKITDCQNVVISKAEHKSEPLDTLVIPVNLFKESDLAPMEIIVWVLKTSWEKSYSTIAKMLNRDPRTIETTFKRAVAKMESD
ncbi:MAG: hypothetical protein KAJ93_01220 [Methanosarcinales archaeon]|nr:hypothetical protein [Methanosarcinales archaeon]